MVDLNAFKSKQRSTSLADIAKAYESKNYTVDNRYWKLTTPEKKDGASNGAIIRFLPSFNPESPLYQYYSYSFKGVSGYYIENSLESIGESDPVREYNSALWNTGDEAKKLDCKTRNRKLHYVANILVVRDPVKPENNGQVFLYQFGSKIYEKISSALEGDELASEEPLNVFDFDYGANFSLNITYSTKIGFFTYDKSKFLSPSSIGDEKTQQSVLEHIYDLDTCEPVKYKSYDELKSRFYSVMGKTTAKPTDDGSDGENNAPITTPVKEQLPSPPAEKQKITIKLPSPPADDDFSDFDSLVDDLPF